MWNDLSRHVARAGLRVGTAILALAALVGPMSAEAKNKHNQVVVGRSAISAAASRRVSERVEEPPQIIVRETHITASGEASAPVVHASLLRPEAPIVGLSRPGAPADQAAKPVIEADEGVYTIASSRNPEAPPAGSIQLGVFREQENAKQPVSKAQILGQSFLASASPLAENVLKDPQELYRARFAGFDHTAAEAACTYFRRNDIDCMMVLMATR
jgi:hypothetical protein